MNSSCFIYSYKDGVLAKLAHDLKFRVARVAVDTDASGTLRALRFDATSLELDCEMKDGSERPGTFSDSDRAKIQKNALDDVLDAKNHPEIRFELTAAVPEGAGYRVSGNLTLRGQTRPIETVTRREGNAQVADVLVHQPAFGITPFSAMLGALKVKPDVLVRFVMAGIA